MAVRIDKSKKIIIDADVIIHFIKGDQLGLLPKIFSNKIYIFDVVFQEVFVGKLRTQVEKLIRFGFIQELEFDGDLQVMIEFAKLKKVFGPGESACMAYCRYYKDVIASSNLKDITSYCQEHSITYITTMDFIHEAFTTGKLTVSQCDDFISAVISNGSRLPFPNMQNYLRSLL